MGRVKTKEERDRKVMANKARKKAVKQAMKKVLEEHDETLEKLSDELTLGQELVEALKEANE